MNAILSFFSMNADPGQLDDLFLTVLNMSGTGAVVIAVILLLRLILKRAPKEYSYWLWAAAAFRLVCPVSWKSVFSIFSLAPHVGGVVPTSDVGAAVASGAAETAASAIEYIPNNIGMQAAPRVELIVPSVSDAISEALPAADPLSSVNPLQVWTYVGAAVWLLGIFAMLLWGVVSYARLARRLRTAVRLSDGVWQSEAVGSPFLLGFLRPRIYIPYGLEGERLDYVLSHERCHIRRRDYLVKLLAFGILAVHWYNPLVWLAFVLMGRDMEMRCDEAVLGRAEAQKKPYSETLLSFAVGGRFPSPGPLAFGESGVKTRIRNALRWRKPRVWVTVLAALLVAVGVAACVSNPSGTKTDAQLKRDAWTAASAAAKSADVSIEKNKATLTRSDDGTLVTVDYPVTEELYRSTDAEGVERVEIVKVPTSQASVTVTYYFDPDDLKTPQRAEAELTGPTPWVWCHTVEASELRGEVHKFAQDEIRYDLTEAQLSGLCAALRTVRPEAVAGGRGYPLLETVTLTDAQGRTFTLGFGGDCVVLSFDDGTAQKWPIYPAPGWEIRDAALLAYLDALTEEKETVLTAVLEEIPISFRDDYLFCTVRDVLSGVRYSVPLVNAEPSPEPRIGDTLEIVCTGAWPADGGEFDASQIVHISVVPDAAPQAEVHLDESLPDGLPEALLEWAKEYTASVVEWQDQAGRELERPYTIVDAKVTGLTRIPTGTAALDHDIQMWLLEHRLLADHPERVLLAGGAQMDGDWYTEYTSMGQPCLVLLHDGDGWTRLGVVWTNGCAFPPEVLEQYGGNPYTAECMILYRNYLAERQASQGGALMTVTSGGETVNPYQLLRFSLSWDDARQIWLSADGEPVERVKDEPGVPTLTMAEDFALRYAEGAGRRYPLRIYDENFQMLSDRSPIDTAQLFFLEPGDYYLVFDTYAPGGRYIASQDGYEQSAYDCVVRLHVERQLAQPWTPGAIQYSGSAALAYAHLGSVNLTDDDSRRTLCAILDRAEETYPSECAGSVILFLTDARGRVFGLCPAQDGCGNFWSGGTWYRYGDGNELWELMTGASPGGGQAST